MSEWIPVSERLPGVGDIVLVCLRGRIYLAWRGRNNIWWLRDEEMWIDDPIAWMPLPEPYREDGRDDERVGALIDVIEDFLAERGVRLPESVEDDTVCGGAVVICGGDYDALASRIKWFFGDGHEL